MSLKTQRVPTTSPEDLGLIIHADHWNPFHVLGPHDLPSEGAPAKVVRAFLPEARHAWLVDLTRGEPGVRTPMERIHPDGFYRAGRRRSVPLVRLPPGRRGLRRARLGVRRSLPVRPRPDRLRPPPAGRGDALPQLREARRPPSRARGVPRRPLRRLGPQREARQRGRGTSTTGTAAAIPCGTSARRGSGRSSSPTCRRARSTSSRSRAGSTAISSRSPTPTASPPSSAPRPPPSSGTSPGSRGTTPNGWRTARRRRRSTGRWRSTNATSAPGAARSRKATAS